MTFKITPYSIVRGFEDLFRIALTRNNPENMGRWLKKIDDYIAVSSSLSEEEREAEKIRSQLRIQIIRAEIKLDLAEEQKNHPETIAGAAELAQLFHQLSATYASSDDFAQMNIHAKYDKQAYDFEVLVIQASDAPDTIEQLQRLAKDYYDLSLRYKYIELADEQQSIEFYKESINLLLDATNRTESYLEKAKLLIEISSHYYQLAVKYRDSNSNQHAQAEQMLEKAQSYKTIAEDVASVAEADRVEDSMLTGIKEAINNQLRKRHDFNKETFFQRKRDTRAFSELKRSFRGWFNPTRFIRAILEFSRQANYAAENSNALDMLDVYQEAIAQKFSTMSNRKLLKLSKNLHSRDVTELMNTLHVMSIEPERLGLVFDTDQIEAHICGTARNNHMILERTFDAMTVTLKRRGLAVLPFDFMRGFDIDAHYQANPSRKTLNAIQHVIRDITLGKLQFIEQDSRPYRTFEQLKRSFRVWFNPHRFIKSIITLCEQVNINEPNAEFSVQLQRYNKELTDIFRRTSSHNLLILHQQFASERVVELMTQFASVASHAYHTDFMPLSNIDKLNAYNIFHKARITLECLRAEMTKRNISTDQYKFRDPMSFTADDTIHVFSKNRDCIKSILKYVRKKQEQQQPQPQRVPVEQPLLRESGARTEVELAR